MFTDRKAISERCHFPPDGSVGLGPFISSSGLPFPVQKCLRLAFEEVGLGVLHRGAIGGVAWGPPSEKEGGGGERGGRPAEAAGVVGSWLY